MSDATRVVGSPTAYKAELREGSTRRYVVQAAVELVHAHVAAGCQDHVFEKHIENIGAYADAIEAALKKA